MDDKEILKRMYMWANGQSYAYYPCVEFDRLIKQTISLTRKDERERIIKRIEEIENDYTIKDWQRLDKLKKEISGSKQ